MPDTRTVEVDNRRVWQGPHPATVAARLALLVLVGTLSVTATRDIGSLFWTLLLAAASIPALLAPRHRILGPLTRLAEVVIVCLATDVIVTHASDTGTAVAAVLPHLAVPVPGAGPYLHRVEPVPPLVLPAGPLVGLCAPAHPLPHPPAPVRD